jgi:hypothetical protein
MYAAPPRVVRRSRARRNQHSEPGSGSGDEQAQYQQHTHTTAQVHTLEAAQAPQRPEWVHHKGTTLSGVVRPFESVKVRTAGRRSFACVPFLAGKHWRSHSSPAVLRMLLCWCISHLVLACAGHLTPCCLCCLCCRAGLWDGVWLPDTSGDQHGPEELAGGITAAALAKQPGRRWDAAAIFSGLDPSQFCQGGLSTGLVLPPNRATAARLASDLEALYDMICCRCHLPLVS